ncbi:CRISPR-associated endoribonuclease Cas6 [Actinacidiphila sp. DG2A-62]|uniref:CRISPR-associated endoribonuclease Cas6 n=1 Tax=Actinacidiphila sp. DG2A-62 TaxID=3108821 RepID=UPI002DBDD0AF|nr:CRISPR-associated endoribonuclease Cas6 [Actinacidiphila sp. DG2A-62]MEC3996090.1 CRISPR-associated endoribonuclease Cas6 [Actinacidiphila sp. DG2A-62]
MRLRVDVASDAPSLAWDNLHGPARGVVYGLLREHDPQLARSLHDDGWKGQPMKPVGVACPRFRGVRRQKGVYAASSQGSVWFASPVPEIASALVSALARRTEIDWGTAKLRVRGFTVDIDNAAVADGFVEVATATPVVVRHDRWDLLPGDEHYVERVTHNLVHKADVLGLPAPQGVRVLEAGPRRRFSVRGAPRIGARVRLGMEADARFVDALRSWGVGLDTIQGFGWVE